MKMLLGRACNPRKARIRKNRGGDRKRAPAGNNPKPPFQAEARHSHLPRLGDDMGQHGGAHALLRASTAVCMDFISPCSLEITFSAPRPPAGLRPRWSRTGAGCLEPARIQRVRAAAAGFRPRPAHMGMEKTLTSGSSKIAFHDPHARAHQPALLSGPTARHGNGSPRDKKRPVLEGRGQQCSIHVCKHPITRHIRLGFPGISAG